MRLSSRKCCRGHFLFHFSPLSVVVVFLFFFFFLGSLWLKTPEGETQRHLFIFKRRVRRCFASERQIGETVLLFYYYYDCYLCYLCYLWLNLIVVSVTHSDPQLFTFNHWNRVICRLKMRFLTLYADIVGRNDRLSGLIIQECCYLPPPPSDSAPFDSAPLLLFLGFFERIALNLKWIKCKWRCEVGGG